MMSAQEQIRKMLEKEFDFEFVSAKQTTFGKRWTLRCPNAGLEAQLGTYRIGFYGICDDGEAKPNLPTALKPLCFGTDHKSDIRAFLQKTLNVSGKNTRQKVLFAAT